MTFYGAAFRPFHALIERQDRGCEGFWRCRELVRLAPQAHPIDQATGSMGFSKINPGHFLSHMTF